MDSITGLSTLYSSLTGFYIILFFLIVIVVTVLVVIGLQLTRTNDELKKAIDLLLRRK